MAMNFMGLGFSFGATDKGFGKQVASANKSFALMKDSIAGIGLIAGKALKMPNLKPLGSLVQTMANDTKVTTTQLEAFGVQATKVASAGLAGLDLTTKQFKKAKGVISSVAFSMNIDIGTVTQTMVALKQSSVDVTKIGFKSFKQFQKFMSVTGTDSTKFAANVARMRTQFKMTDEQIKAMIQTTAAMGKKLNIGKQAIGGMTETVRIMSEEGSQFFKSWGPDRVQEYVIGTTRVAGALVKMGATASDAMTSSQAFTKQLVKGQSGMKDLFSGLATDMGTDMETLTQHLGSVDTAFEALQKSPDAFALHMATMSKRVQAFAKAQLRATDEFKGMTDEQLKNSKTFETKLGVQTEKMTDRFTSQMTSAFGPGVTNLINRGFGEVEDVINSTQGEMKGGEKIIDSYANKYKDGRTAAERFAIAESRLYTRLKQVHGVMSDTEFLKEYGKQTTNLVGVMDNLAKKGGPVGKATQMMIEFANFGVGGVLGKMIGPPDIGLALGALLKKFGPLLSYLPAISVAMKSLFSPITLVAGAIAGLFFVIKDLQKGADSVIRPFIDKFAAQLPELLEKVVDFLGTAFKAVAHAIKTIFDKINWKKVGEFIGKGLMLAFDLALVVVAKALDLTLRILTWFVNINWKKVGKTIGNMLSKAFLMALSMAAEIIKRLPELIYKAVVGAVDLIAGALDSITDNLSKKFPILSGIFAILSTAIKGIGVALIAYAVVSLALTLHAAIATAVGWLIAWAPVIALGLAVSIVFYAIYKALKWLVEKVIWAGKKLWEAISEPFLALVGAVVGVFNDIVDLVGDAIGAIGDFFSGGGEGMGGVVGKHMEEMKKASAMTAEAMAAKAAMEAAKAEAARVKAAGIAITTIKDLAKETDAAVVKSVNASVEAGKRVITVSGNIIDADKAIIQWSQDAEGNLKKVVYQANEIAKAKITFKPMVEGKKIMDGFRAATEKARRENEDLGPILDRYKDKFKAFKKAHGFAAQEASGWNTLLSRQLGVQTKLFDKLRGTEKGYAEALEKRQTAVANNAAAEMAELLKLQAIKRKGIDMTAEQVAEEEAERIAITQKYEGWRKEIAEAAIILTEGLASTFEGVVVGSQQAMLEGERAGKIFADAMKARGADVIKGLGNLTDETKSHVQDVYSKIAETQAQELKNFLGTTKLRGDALNAEVAKIRAGYDEMTKTVTANAKLAGKNLRDGLTEGFDDMNKNIIASLEKTGKQATETAKAQAGTITKEMGLSGDAAMKAVGQIANISPRRFRTNMRVIKKHFVKFIKAMNTETGKMTKETAKNLNKFWTDSKKGWDDQTALIETFGSTMETALQESWRKMARKSQIGTQALVIIVANMMSDLRDISSRFNILDALSPSEKIVQWADDVTLALVRAFMGKGVFDKAIGSFTASTVALLSELETKKGVLESDTTAAKARRASTKSELGRLADAVHNPRWADSGSYIPTHMNAQTKLLGELLRVLSKQKGAAVSARVEEILDSLGATG